MPQGQGQGQSQAQVAGAQEAARRAADLAVQVQKQILQEMEQAQPRVIVGSDGQPRIIAGDNSPAAVYEARKQARNELEEILDRLENQREDLADEIQSNPAMPASAKAGIESRITAIDGRITAVEAQIAEADAAVAAAAAIPGAVQPPPPPPPERGPPEEVWMITSLFIVFVMFPVAIAFARRIWKRTSAAVAAIPQDIYERFNRLDQAIDSVAIEVERIGEGQRYLTRLNAGRELGAGAAERIEAPEREPARQPRK